MSVPKKKLSKSRTKSRRSHHAMSAPASTACEKCGATIQPHRACTQCGFYRGKNVLSNQKRVEKKVAQAPTAQAVSKE